MPGAAGGPKGIGIQGTGSGHFGEFFPVPLSVERWSVHPLAAGVLPVSRPGEPAGTERLADLYTHLYFHKKMTRQEVSDVCRGMLLDLVQGKETDLVNHPDYHLTVLSIKAQHIFQSDKRSPARLCSRNCWNYRCGAQT